MDNLRREMEDLILQHASNIRGQQSRFEQAHECSWCGLAADLDAKYAAIDKDLDDLKSQSRSTLDRLCDHQTIMAQQQSSIDLLTEQGLARDKCLSELATHLLRSESHLQGHRTKTDESLASLRTDVNDTRARLTVELPDIRRELQTTTQNLSTAIR
jgi:hypothetical protein